jgi:hypothetical protein
MKILVFRSEHNTLLYEKIMNTFYYRSNQDIFSLWEELTASSKYCHKIMLCLRNNSHQLKGANEVQFMLSQDKKI